MGLFDHLFKAKSPSAEDKGGEHALEGSATARPAEGATRTQTPSRADPSAFLHPKNFVPRGAPGLTPAPRPSSAMSGKSGERRATRGWAPPPAPDEIVLTLGDVLSRIPTHYLKPGAHDAKRELRFKINDLSSDIARGRAAVPLSRIAQLVPEIFVKAISRDEDAEVRLPLQKLVEQIGLLRSQPKASVVEKIARPITTVELPPMAKPVLRMEARKEPVVVPSVVEPMILATGGAQTPPIILAEPASSRKAFELKPAADTMAPVILGPRPVVDTPAVTVAPVPREPEPAPAVPEPAPAVPEPAPAVPEAKQPVEPPTSAPEPEAVPEPEPEPEPAMAIPTAPPGAPPITLEPQKIAIHWGEDMAAKAGEEPRAYSAPAAEGPKLAPLESPQLDPGEESIQLSLAAILRNCPHEIVVGPLPHVDDSVRITLPFAPIDRQLIKGQVEVSALRFIAALPEAYQKYFVAKVGVKVPIPLEEVFQNLPTPTHELIPAPPVPPPIVLAPAALAVAVAPPASLPEEKEEELPVSPAPSEPPKNDVPAESVVAPPTPLPEVVPPEVVPPAATEPLPIPSVAASMAPETPQAGRPELVPPGPAAPLEPTVAPASEIEPPSEPAATLPEASSAVLPSEVAPPPLPIFPAAESTPAESTPAASSEPSQVPFHPPVFRPHFMVPPPIFGFTAPPIAPELEPAAKPEPPSVPAGLTDAAAPAPVPEALAGETAIVAPAAETPVQAPGGGIGPREVGASPEAGSEAEPTPELMALATEHAAPDLVQFSSEPVPYADLAETLAHETTYASDLAEVVHIPDAESSEPKPASEDRAVPIVEGLAAAAVAAAIAEHAPSHLHDVAPVVEQPTPPGEAAAPAETPAAEKPAIAEPVAAEQPAPPAESVTEPEKAAPAPDRPDVPPSEPPTSAVPPPPPHPLFSLPKLSVEPARLEVLPPPSLPLRRFDQDAVQALFMTEEALDLPKISRLAAALPGVYACVIATRDQACTGGTLPEGFDLAALLGLAPRVGEAAGRMPIGQLKHFTLYGDAYSVSFFERNGLSLCAVHRPRSFVPGVREKLVALADELSL